MIKILNFSIYISCYVLFVRLKLYLNNTLAFQLCFNERNLNLLQVLQTFQINKLQ